MQGCTPPLPAPSPCCSRNVRSCPIRTGRIVRLNPGPGGLRPNRISNPNSFAKGSTLHCFTTAAFSRVPLFTIRNRSRNPVIGRLQSQDRFEAATLIFAGWLCLHYLWPPSPQVPIAVVGYHLGPSGAFRGNLMRSFRVARDTPRAASIKGHKPTYR